MGKGRNTQRNATIVIVILIIAILSFAFFFQERVYRERFFSVPEINTDMVSSNGTVHNVRAKFELELDESVRSEVSSYELRNAITEIIESMEYDTVVDYDGLLYVKEKMRDGLTGYIDPDMLHGIYVWDFITDEQVVAQETLPPNLQPLMDVFGAIWGKKD